MELSGQLHAPSALGPEKEPQVPIGYEVGWTPVGIPFASHYTDWGDSTQQLY
jgi:hypothetical protein